jgi:hypothetical protein
MCQRMLRAYLSLNGGDRAGTANGLEQGLLKHFEEGLFVMG